MPSKGATPNTSQARFKSKSPKFENPKHKFGETPCLDAVYRCFEISRKHYSNEHCNVSQVQFTCGTLLVPKF